jgi:glycosyltransferase 2 family protein
MANNTMAQTHWFNHRLRMALKFVVGIGLVFYVLHSKMVDFRAVQAVLFNPVNLLVSITFLGLSALCCAARWYLLVKAQGLSLSFKDMVELTMIGNFFNTFMPGSVGGDLIKAWYVAGQEPTRKTKAIFTVLLDRFIGLSVIIFYAACTLLFFTEWLPGHKELRATALSIWAFTAFCGLFAVFFYSPKLWNSKPTTAVLDLLRRNSRLAKIVDAGLLYRQHLPAILIALLLSAASILGTTLIYAIEGKTIGLSIDMARYFFIVPIGITVSAIPILPGGIGVGQVAFFTLFQWVGSPNPEQGATLCTLMQVYTILFNCIGAFFYLKFKRKPSEIPSLNTVSVQPKQVGHLM